MGGNRLQWDAVHDAAAYRVAYRAASDEIFTELVSSLSWNTSDVDIKPPVTSSELTFDAERLRLDAGAEFYIQSVRPPFADSLPSGTLKLQTGMFPYQNSMFPFVEQSPTSRFQAS